MHYARNKELAERNGKIKQGYADGMTQVELGKKFGIPTSSISLILNNALSHFAKGEQESVAYHEAMIAWHQQQIERLQS